MHFLNLLFNERRTVKRRRIVKKTILLHPPGPADDSPHLLALFLCSQRKLIE